MPPAKPPACKRCSPPAKRSRYETAVGSSKIRAAAAGEVSFFRRLVGAFSSSQTKVILYTELWHSAKRGGLPESANDQSGLSDQRNGVTAKWTILFLATAVTGMSREEPS